MSQDRKLQSTEPIEPVGRVTIDKLIAVCPERTEEWLALWRKGFPKIAALRLIERIQRSSQAKDAHCNPHRRTNTTSKRKRTRHQAPTRMAARRW